MSLKRLISCFRISAANEEMNKSESTAAEAGWDRVVKLWKDVATGEHRVESQFISETLVISSLSGFIYGNIFASREAIRDFIRRHNEYTFKGEFEARRRLVDYMMIRSFRVGWKFMWRFAFFATPLTILTFSVINYRNNFYIRDVAACSALMGGLWKSNLGLRGIISGAVIAGFLGTVLGSTVKLYIICSGFSVPDYIYYLHNEYEYYLREEAMKKNRKIAKDYDRDKKAFALLIEKQEKLEAEQTKLMLSESFFDS